MSIVPDYKPKNLRARIEPKCSVLHIPVIMIAEPSTSSSNGNSPAPNDDSATSATGQDNNRTTPGDASDLTPRPDKPLHILWPHRW